MVVENKGAVQPMPTYRELALGGIGKVFLLSKSSVFVGENNI